MKSRYTFTILRYVHDVVTGEFANVGLALFAPDAKYLGAICLPRYGRLSRMFLNVDGDYFRSLMRFVETRFEELADKLRNELPLEKGAVSIMEFATKVLPQDDSSLQWSTPGGGVTENPAATLEQLYIRMVEKYEEKQRSQSRTDEEIWRVFRQELEAHHVIAHLQSKRIVAKDYDYEFEHAWKNEKWHLYEPVSFDLQDSASLLDKANRWLGRAVNLHDAPESFKLYMLLAEPSLERLKPVYVKAENILNKMPCEKEFVREHEAERFSLELAKEIAQHEAE